MDGRRGRGLGRRQPLAHRQSRDDLALAGGVPERLRRAHGLDNQALRRGQPPPGSPSWALRSPHCQAWRRRSSKRRRLKRPGRRRFIVSLVLLSRGRALVASSATSGQPVPITNFDQVVSAITIPTGRVMPPGVGSMHIILEVTDHGTPRLTRYRRVIVEVKE